MDKNMDNVSANPISLIETFLLIVILNCICIHNQFYSSIWYVFQSLLSILSYIKKLCSESKSNRIDVPAIKPCIQINIEKRLLQGPEMVMEKPEVKNKTTSANHLALNSCFNENLDDDDELTIEEVAMIMGKLGTSYDPDGDKLQERLASSDIATLFEEQEPSLQEVKDAFDLFDENNDGFIDAIELKKVLSTLCFAGTSEVGCKTMIQAYDDNGDGLIDFREFVRLVSKSFN